MNKLTDRERLLRVLEYEDVDRGVYGVHTGPWPETLVRWRSEGLPADADLQAWAAQKFPDRDHWDWQGHWFFPFPAFEHRTVSEDERTILYVNHEGILMRERKDQPFSSMPQFVKFPVETAAEFRTFAKERLQPNFAERLGADGIAALQEKRTRDYPLIVIADRWGGFFGPLRNLTGVETLCTLFYDNISLVEEMMDTICDFLIQMLDSLLDVTDIDVFGFWEDMAYKTGPLISPQFVKQYMVPRYRKVVDFLHSRGVKWIALDSDGQVSDLMPHWMDAGINILYPFEPQAGMDVLQVRKKFGRDLRIWGGVDKRTLALGKREIDEELARVRPLIEEGGYVAHPDHSLPPDVPFENFLHFMKELRKTVSF
jgi:uroporphyrinogen-III decarboxylase